MSDVIESTANETAQVWMVERPYPADSLNILVIVEDPETRERYEAEAERMAGRHDPDETV